VYSSKSHTKPTFNTDVPYPWATASELAYSVDKFNELQNLDAASRLRKSGSASRIDPFR